ncbi:DNA-binding transcriptional regulator, MarR family [Paenibacillus sp. UNC496MF]|uniref:MarR family winged helix-turn-helix transcriptional regulator n=1 Tax=Paenibacillus sp. UNC496MF TaxID=1502753 RepID=UPI0008ED52BE|nr:MarR family transcriptional regulator [Paenibacillus sp. UNC496MF]SFJ24327.1 DNA-binding transcriptional regulator, MarR family [Paenibacillus sp. UNC496MF]
MQDDREHPSPSAHELIRALRQLRQLPWNNRNPIENCTPSETMTLFCIRRATDRNPAGVKASELSTMLNVASPTITQSVNLLVAKGLLQRSADPQDRRAVRITLTEEGMRLTGLAQDAMQERMTRLVAHLGSDRAHQLVELLHDVASFFGGDEAGPGNGGPCRNGWNPPTTSKEGE